jgi:NitT/TauT family transport system substrate-binding protein
MTAVLRRMLGALVIAAGMGIGVAGARAETITVTHYGSAFYGAPYAVAMAKGFFKQNGVDITGILTSAGGGTSVRNMLASDLPFGEVALSAAVAAINHGEPLKILFGGVDTVKDIVWIAKTGSPLHSFADLKGKRVGFTAPGSATNMILLMALKAHGMTQADMHLIAAGDVGANLSAVLTGAVDTGMTNEPVWSENQGKVQQVFGSCDVAPCNMMQSVGVTTIDYLATAAGQKKLAGITAGRREGVEYIYAHPDEAADIVAKAYNGDAALYRKVFQNFVQFHYWTPGVIDKEGMDHMVEGLQIMGQQKGPVDWGKIVDARFLAAKTN